MKREIEFRGQRADNKEWVYGYYVHNTYAVGFAKEPTLYENHYIYSKNFISESWFNTAKVEVIPKTVGQYVGITDKNGKKIFEGDIVKDEYGRIMEVVWREKFAKFAFKLIKTTGATWTENFLYADIGEWFDLADHLPEIVGTVFDKESDK